MPKSSSTTTKIVTALSVVASIALLSLIAWGFLYHPGYSELIPGDAQPIGAKVTVKGAKQYDPAGDIYLVFVRERENLNYWEYWRAKLFDDDAQISKIPDGAPTSSTQENACLMEDSQATAKSVALEKLGFEIGTKPGVFVQQIFDRTAPVAKVLDCGDVIRKIDDERTDTQEQLSKAVARHAPGDTVKVTFEREGKTSTGTVKLIKDQEGKPRLGIFARPVVVYPVDLTIDTGAIGGPSAGLAMTLTLLDELTPGELTGKRRVVATGTIEPDGTVGEIGAIDLKAVAVRRRNADLFLVPACQEDPKREAKALAACEQGISEARRNAKGVKVVPVRNLDDALKVLRSEGGDALPTSVAAAVS